MTYKPNIQDVFTFVKQTKVSYLNFINIPDIDKPVILGYSSVAWPKGTTYQQIKEWRVMMDLMPPEKLNSEGYIRI